MNGRTSGTRWLVLLMATTLGAVACGDDDGDEAATEPAEEIAESEPESEPEVDPGSITTDYGADDKVIRVGVLADLSGPFSALVKDIVLAQQAYWKQVNDAGGIAGRQVELVIEDQKYDVPTHKQKFQAMAAKDSKGVLILSQSTGSPHTAAIRSDLEAADLVAIPLSYFSGWADPAFGKNVFEAYSNYCFQAMNSLQYLFDTEKIKTLSIATFPGEFGQDGAKGAKLAAEALGLEIVYDGEGAVVPPSPTNPNPDHSGVVSSIIDAKADATWVTVNPAALASIMSQSASKGYEGKWVGSFGAYHESLLKSDVKDLIDSSYYHSTFTAAFGTDVPGMDEMIAAIAATKPDARPSDAYVLGWTEAQITEAVLRQAAESGDMTRKGVVKAAFALDKVDFDGLAPEQTWKGNPNDYLVRETYLFKPKLALYDERPITEQKGGTGAELLKGPFASQTAKEYDYNTLGPCFKPAQ